ncbi:MAG: GGDEF domain-containing protein [Lachnospiraceae bacterium]
MTEFYHVLRQTLNGVRPMNDKIKYPVISYAIAFVHFTFACLFGYLHVTPLLVYNIFITVFYIVIGVLLAKTERYTGIFLAAMIEILFHSILATVMLGWGWGFMLYTISLIPVIFYLTYTLAYFKGNIAVPMLTSAVVVVCYYVMRFIMSYMPHTYPTDDIKYMEKIFYFYNTTLTFLLLYTCSVLFSVEVRYMRKSLEQENRNLGEIANYDPLTHLLNRRSMNHHMKQAMETADGTGQEFCLIMGDIDNFKKVNDTYGHACGDTVLTTIARVISDNVRENDVVCRWGGEEILVLVNADREIACQVAERICKNIANTVVKHDDKELSVTMTLGVAAYMEGQTIRSIIDEADNHLYYGKKHGKNQVVS